MGTWGIGTDQNDEALDFFGDFFGDLFGPKKIGLLREAFKYRDTYDKFRAACHVLQMFGNSRYWPRRYREELKELLDLGIKRLTEMIHPAEGERSEFLELWAHEREEITASVQEQLDDLKKKRERLK